MEPHLLQASLVAERVSFLADLGDLERDVLEVTRNLTEWVAPHREKL